MEVLWCVAVLFVGINAQNQQYGPPDHFPGIPMGIPVLSDIIKSSGYESASPVVLNYPEPPTRRATPSSAPSYGPPSYYPPASRSTTLPPPAPVYGVPTGAEKQRFKIIPAMDFQIPEQHSNLIRYIVLKEFQIGQNGSTTPLQMGLGRDNGNGSPELEIMKVQMPGSAESGSAEGTSPEVSEGGYQSDATSQGGQSQGGYSNGPTKSPQAPAQNQGGYSNAQSHKNQGGYSNVATSMKAQAPTIQNQGGYANAPTQSQGSHSQGQYSIIPSKETQGGYADLPIQGGYSDVPSQGAYADTPSQDVYTNNEYNGEDNYNEQQINHNSVESVVPAHGVDLSNAAPIKATDTEAFMFSDPIHNSVEVQNRGTGGVRTNQNTIRNRLPNRHNQHRNKHGNQNRHRVTVTTTTAHVTTAEPVTTSAPSTTTIATTKAAISSTLAPVAPLLGIPRVDELQSALQTLSRYFSSQAQAMKEQMGAVQAAEGARSIGDPPSNSFFAPAEVSSSYATAPTFSSGPYPEAISSTATPDITSHVSTAASSAESSPSSSAFSEIGGYTGSGQPESGESIAEEAVVQHTLPVTQATQASFSTSTYGTQPGLAGFRSSSFADAITRPIQTTARFKAAVITSGANLLTAGIKSVAAATGAVSRGLTNVGSRHASSSSNSVSSSTDPAPVYGPPSTTAASVSPLGQIVGLKGRALRTVAKTGRAAINIAGTKGQLVVKQVGTVASTFSKGVGSLLNNNHDAFQNVVKHIQAIFQANERLSRQQE